MLTNSSPMKRKHVILFSCSNLLAIALCLISITLHWGQTVADPLCQPPDQVALKTATNSSDYICVPCISHCPSGLQPLTPCGASGISQACVLCPKDSYKEKHDGSQCIPCTVCGQGYETLRNCTRDKNTICSKSCKREYYRQETLDACLPCSRCCFDGSDKVVAKCKNRGMPPHLQCEVGNTRCQSSVTSTLPSKTAITTTTTTTATTTAATTRSSSSTTTTPPPKSTAAKILSKRKKKAGPPRPTLQDTFSAFSSTKNSSSISAVTQNSLDERSNQKFQDSNNLPLTIGLTVTVILLIILVLVLVFMLRRKKKHVSLMESGRNGGKSQTRQPGTSGRSPEGTELQDVAAAKETKLLEPLETKTAVHPEKKEAAVVPLETYEDQESMLLKDLERFQLDLYDLLCSRLDAERKGSFEFERVGIRFGLEEHQYQSLRNEFQRRGGSPSKLLMETLRTMKPQLTVTTFCKELRQLGLSDIAVLLERAEIGNEKC